MMSKNLKENGIVIFALCAFAIYLALGVMHHEAWRDEWQSINIAKAAASLSDLYGRLRYEGHPVLWYLFTKAALSLHPSLTSVQILNCCIAIAAAGLVAFFAPWPLWLRVMAAFSGPAAWEFSVKARSYGLGWLILVAIALAIRRMKSRQKPWIIIVLASLALNTSLFTGIVAYSLVLGWLWEEYRFNIRSIILPISILAVVTAGSFFVMLPPSDCAFGLAPYDVNLAHVDELARRFTYALLPINYLFHVPFAFLIIIALALILAVLSTVCSNTGSLIALVSGWVITYVLILYKMIGFYPWHCWHFFMLVIAVGIAFGNGHEKSRKAIASLSVIAFLGLAEGVKEYVHDLNTSYSAAKKTAQAISGAGLAELPILVIPDEYVASLSGYLGKPLYSLTRNNMTYVIWNKQRLVNVNWLDRAINLANSSSTHSCLVSIPTPLNTSYISYIMTKPNIDFRLFGQYMADKGRAEHFSTNENYCVYLLHVI